MSHRKEQKAEARELRLEAERERQEHVHRNRVRALIAAGAAMLVAVVLIVVLAGSDGGDEPSTPATKPAKARAFAGVPQDGTSLGKPSARAVLTEFADLQCPFCAEFATGVLPAIVDEYVKTGKLRIEIRLLRFIGPDSDRGARAALEAARRDRMWDFVDAFYRNQGQEGTGYADDDFIRDIAREAGVRADPLLAAIEAGRHEKQISEGEGEAQEAGLDSTPSFTIRRRGGEAEKLAVPQLTPDAFRAALDDALR